MPEDLTRWIDAPRDAVWRAWSEHLVEWWCPQPWTGDIIEQLETVAKRIA